METILGISVGSDHLGFTRSRSVIPFQNNPAAPGFRGKRKQAARVVTMGFIHIEDLPSQYEQPSKSTAVQAKDRLNSTGARSFKVAGLVSDQVSTPTCMKEEVVLLSWLIVLLRTREDGHVGYEWAYQTQGDSPNGGGTNKLSTDEVLPKLQDNVRETLSSISRHIENAKGRFETAESSYTSLLLSTGSLSESSDGTNNDVRESFNGSNKEAYG